jgi:hypothetical protein
MQDRVYGKVQWCPPGINIEKQLTGYHLVESSRREAFLLFLIITTELVDGGLMVPYRRWTPRNLL